MTATSRWLTAVIPDDARAAFRLLDVAGHRFGRRRVDRAAAQLDDVVAGWRSE